MNWHRLHAIYLIIILTIISLTGCGKAGNQDADESDRLVTVGDSTLMLADVLRQIPSGLMPEDSLEMLRTLTDNWVRTAVLANVAKENAIDMQRIDRQVEDYRNMLVIDEYLRHMESSNIPTVKDDEIKAYYEAYADQLTLNQPAIKGVYIKMANVDPRLNDVRHWMQKATDVDIDNIEQYGTREAIQYEYFADKWIDWNLLAERIPYRFDDADAFLKNTVNFETTHDDATYLLHIYEYLPSGSKMPYEYATEQIRGILTDNSTALYREKLLKSIYTKAIKDGKLKKGIYDPVTGKIATGTKPK